MKKVKKFPLAEFLGFIISARKCVILDMFKAIEKCKNHLPSAGQLQMKAGGNKNDYD